MKRFYVINGERQDCNLAETPKQGERVQLRLKMYIVRYVAYKDKTNEVAIHLEEDL